MAKKHLPTPPSSSSSGEEYSSSDDEKPSNTKPMPQSRANNKEEESNDESGADESESSDDDEGEDADAQPDNKKPQASASTPSKSAPESESESDDSDDSDDSESDSEAAKLVTPISSKPMAESPAVADKSNGKAMFQRIWTLEDEITILKGMAEYQAERGPVKMNSTEIADFHNFIKKSLSLGVSNSQLADKIRRLKKKYSAAAARAKRGVALKFSKPHDQTLYELGKKAWGSESEEEHEERARGATVNSSGGGRSLKRNFPFLKEAVEMRGKAFAEEALKTIDQKKAEILEKRFKNQKVAEMKHHLHKMDLWKDTFKLVMDGIERAAG